MPENDHVRHVQQSYNGVIFALFLGGIGVLKFYAKPVSESCTCSSAGTFVPAIVDFVEGIVYLSMSDESFNVSYKRRVRAQRIRRSAPCTATSAHRRHMPRIAPLA